MAFVHFPLMLRISKSLSKCSKRNAGAGALTFPVLKEHGFMKTHARDYAPNSKVEREASVT